MTAPALEARGLVRQFGGLLATDNVSFQLAPGARQALIHRVGAVRVTEGAKPTVIIAGRSLMVSFVPGESYDGRASSHAIAHALGKLLQVSVSE